MYSHKRLFLVVVVTSAVIYLAYSQWFATGFRNQSARTAIGIWLNKRWYGNNRPELWMPISRVVSESRTRPARMMVAVGGGITSKSSLFGPNETNAIRSMPIFDELVPSFCATSSPAFDYAFYLAYDDIDRLFADRRRMELFQTTFRAEVHRLCAPRNVSVELRLVPCRYTGKPAWSQNDAMLSAYLDDVDFFYRINDDTRMLSGGWTEAFVSALDAYDPPRFGVVGPNHRGGGLGALTYDFVHMTHVDVLGFYYPRIFPDWWADVWMTMVYQPNRSTKIMSVGLRHTLRLGTRYKVTGGVKEKLNPRLDRDKVVLNRYIEAVRSNRTTPDGRKVISMSLYGDNPRYIWGAIRNAQLVPVHMPEWTLRVHVAAEDKTGAPSGLVVSARIINKLRLLGAQIVRVPSSGGSLGVSPRNWRLLVINSNNVDYFLIRDADYRTSDREAAAVREWIAEAERSDSAAIHCIRDHPKHANQTIVDGLWGGRRRGLANHPSSSLLQPSNATRPDSGETKNFARWAESLHARLYCHDSVSPCDRWPPSTGRRSFPVARQLGEYVGRKYNEHQEPIVGDRSGPAFRDVECLVPSGVSSGHPTPGTPRAATSGTSRAATTSAIASLLPKSSTSLSSVSPSRP